MYIALKISLTEFESSFYTCLTEHDIIAFTESWLDNIVKDSEFVIPDYKT